MGIKWAGKYWVFRSLQMGLSSSPRIYTAFADAVEYACVSKNRDISYLNGVQQLRHYIDDFFGALPNKEDAERLYQALYTTFEVLGIPTKWEKCTSPRQKAKILGWIYDTVLRMVFLPDDKRKLLLDMVQQALRTKKANEKFMRQLIGRLQHASQVIFPGKAFVRKLEALLYLPQHKNKDDFSIGTFVLNDLRWWKRILESPSVCGMSFDLILKHPSDGDIVIYTDACTKIGGGGFITGLGPTQYFQIRWEDTIYNAVLQYRDLDIAVLELLMSVAAVKMIADKAKNLAISIYNDNPGAAGALESKAPPLGRLDLQALMSELATMAYDNKFYWWGIHKTVKESKDMVLADQLSRFKAVDLNKDAIKCSIEKECNELLDVLFEAPRNLPKQRDLSTNVRQMYNILLEDTSSCVKEASMKQEYNILTT